MRLHVRAGDAQDHDALELPLTVSRPRNQALRVAATYGITTENEVKEAIAFPANIRPDLSHLSVVATPTVIGGLEGVFTYMRDYPYACWEQKLSKGLMAAHYRSLTPYLSDTLQWPESQELPERTLALAANYQAPSGGMAYYMPEDQYVSPDLSAYTALAFTWLRARGYAIPTVVETRLHDYLLSYLRHDNAPDFYSRSMRATIHAVALAALAPSGKVHREDLPRYHAQVKEMSLFGKAHYLLALTQVADTAEMQAEVLDMIRAHANETSGKLVFSEEVDVAYQAYPVLIPAHQLCHSQCLVGCQRAAPKRSHGQRRAIQAGAYDYPDPPEPHPLGQHPGKYLLHERLERFQPDLRAGRATLDTACLPGPGQARGGPGADV